MELQDGEEKKDKVADAVSIVSEPAETYNVRPVFRHFIIKDDYSLVKRAREGVNTEVFYFLANAIKMPEKNLAAVINLSPRTISNVRARYFAGSSSIPFTRTIKSWS